MNLSDMFGGMSDALLRAGDATGGPALWVMDQYGVTNSCVAKCALAPIVVALSVIPATLAGVGLGAACVADFCKRIW